MLFSPLEINFQHTEKCYQLPILSKGHLENIDIERTGHFEGGTMQHGLFLNKEH